MNCRASGCLRVLINYIKKWMAKDVKVKNKYYQRYRKYYLGEVVLLVGWAAHYSLFSKFYEEAVFFVDKKAKFILQLLFIMNDYLDEVLLSLFSVFLLMTLNLLLLTMFYIKNKRVGSTQKEMTYSMSVFLGGILMNAFLLLKTIIWPLFLVLFIVSVTIVYIIYVIAKYLYEEKDESYEEQEVIKSKGSFQTKKEAEEYADTFSTHWIGYFSKKGYVLATNITNDKNNEWYVEILVQSAETE